MIPSNDSAKSDREIIITRIFNAPRELVFNTWIEPEHISQWWGPKGFTTRVEEIDVRPGGVWRYVMVAPDNREYPLKGVFIEIDPPERIVTTNEVDQGYEAVKSEHPQGMVTTAIFEDLGGKTKLTLRSVHPSVEDRRKYEEMGAIGGWNSSFDRLDEYLGGKMAG